MISKEDREQYLFVIKELTGREVRRKYARSKLGVVWSILNPVLNTIVISMIFSFMFRRSIEHYPIYFLSGTIFWTLFSNSTNHALSALVDNQLLLRRCKYPKYIFVLSRVLTELVNFGYSCIPYIIALFIFRIPLSWTMLLLPIDILLGTIFAMGMGLILSIIYVDFGDIKHLYSVLLTIWMYCSALFYPVTSLPELVQTIISFNPVYLRIAFARECMMYGRVPSPDIWCKLIVFSFGMLLAGISFYRKRSNHIMQLL